MTISGDYNKDNTILNWKDVVSTTTRQAMPSNPFVNCCWDAVGLAEGTTEEKIQKGTTLLKNILSMIGSGTCTEESDAKNKIQQDNDNAQALANAQKQSLEKFNNIVEKQSELFEQNLEAAENLIKELEEKQVSIEKQKAEVEKIKEEIAQKIEEAQDPSKTAEERSKLLKEIGSLNDNLSQVITELTAIQKEVEDDNKNLDNLNIEQETLVTESEQEIENEQSNIDLLQTKGRAQVTNNAGNSKKAAEDALISTTAATSAGVSTVSTILSFGASAYQQEQLIDISKQYGVASGTYAAGFTNIYRVLFQGIGGLENNNELLVNFGNAIGTYSTTANESFNIINNTITTLSSNLLNSTENITETVEEIDASLKEDSSTVDNENNSEESEESENNAEIPTLNITNVDLSKLELSIEE